MIDKVLLIKKDNYTPTNLKNFKEQINYKTGEVYKQMYHKGFNIRESYNKISILGSVNKYGAGNNYENISYNDSIDLLYSFGSEIGIDIGEYIIRQLELGSCFDMEQAPHYYINNLINLSRYTSGVYYANQRPTGKVFETYKNKLIIYDKLKEVGKKNIKPEYLDKNILRIEDKYTRQANKSFGFVPKVFNLKDNNFKLTLLNNISTKYKSITKRLNMEIPKNFKTLGEFKKAILLINTNEIEQILNEVNLKLDKGEISPTEASKIRKFINQREELASEFNLSDELNNELQTKFDDRIKKEISQKI